MYTFYSFTIEKDELFTSIINGTWTKKKNSEKNEQPSNLKNNYEDLKADYKLPIYKSPVSNSGAKSIYSQQSGYQSQSIQSSYTKGFPNIISCEYPKTQLIMLERMRKILASKGPKTIIELLRQLKICDDSNRWIIKRNEFKAAIMDFKLDLDPRDIEGICSALDKFCNNEIDLNDFKIAVIGQLKDFRKNLVNKVFENFDQEEANCVLLSHIKSGFNAKLHPDVKMGKRKEDDVLKDFFEMIDMHHSIINNFTSQIFVSRDEFFEFYSIISSCIEADSMFDQHVTNCWNLNFSSNLSKLPYAGISAKIYNVNSKEQWKYDNHKQLYNPDNLSNDFIKSSPSMGEVQLRSESNIAAGLPSMSAKSGIGLGDIEEDKYKMLTDQQILQFLKDKLILRGLRGLFGFIKGLTSQDQFEKREVNLNEFWKVIIDFKIPFNKLETQRIFNSFKKTKDGKINIDDIARTFIGPSNIFRNQSIDKVLKKVEDKINSNNASLNSLKSLFNPTNHFEVKSGRRKDDDVFTEFLDCLDLYLQFKKLKGDSISKDVLKDFFTLYGNNIKEDKEFEITLLGCWNIK